MDNSSEATAKKIGKARRIVHYSVAVAASILLIFVCIVGYNFYRLSPGRLFAENYTPYELTTTPDDSIESKIEKAYREKNYAEVIKLNAKFFSISKRHFPDRYVFFGNRRSLQGY
jgi:hypothetical protein